MLRDPPTGQQLLKYKLKTGAFKASFKFRSTEKDDQI